MRSIWHAFTNVVFHSLYQICDQSFSVSVSVSVILTRYHDIVNYWHDLLRTYNFCTVEALHFLLDWIRTTVDKAALVELSTWQREEEVMFQIYFQGGVYWQNPYLPIKYFFIGQIPNISILFKLLELWKWLKKVQIYQGRSVSRLIFQFFEWSSVIFIILLVKCRVLYITITIGRYHKKCRLS